MLRAAYDFPYLAHAPMEPLNCVVQLSKDGCEIWNGEQFHTTDQINVAQRLGIKPEQVKLNMLHAGGSFGRRANPSADYVLEAVSIAQAILIESGQRDALDFLEGEDVAGGGFPVDLGEDDVRVIFKSEPEAVG